MYKPQSAVHSNIFGNISLLDMISLVFHTSLGAGRVMACAPTRDEGFPEALTALPNAVWDWLSDLQEPIILNAYDQHVRSILFTFLPLQFRDSTKVQ
jgi:hypothetical protein